jgi:hypothetical protein
MSAGRLEVQLIKTFFEVLRKMQRLLIQPDTRCSWTTDTGFPLPLRAGNLDIRDAMPAQSQAKYRVVRDLRDI